MLSSCPVGSSAGCFYFQRLIYLVHKVRLRPVVILLQLYAAYSLDYSPWGFIFQGGFSVGPFKLVNKIAATKSDPRDPI